VVTEDTYISRPDLGDNAFTLVAAGDRVPVGLERHKRSPARRKG
jgi:hypothetical protein